MQESNYFKNECTSMSLICYEMWKFYLVLLAIILTWWQCQAVLEITNLSKQGN